MIKIEQSFVANLGRSAQDSAIVASVISMASAFGLEVVGEGVENEAQAQQLRDLGCGLAQGYYFGEPA
jgi:EAL domain-containing protein (putative c-di-GMP-specific phosphodiesterase class I)